MLFVVGTAAMALVASPLIHAPKSLRAAVVNNAPLMRFDDSAHLLDRRAVFNLAAAGIVFGASVPAAHAGTREEGVAKLRKEYQKAHSKTAYGTSKKTPIFTPSGKKGDSRPPGANKCNMEKPCKDGAGIKWDAKALGVQKAETRKFMKS